MNKKKTTCDIAGCPNKATHAGWMDHSRLIQVWVCVKHAVKVVEPAKTSTVMKHNE